VLGIFSRYFGDCAGVFLWDAGIFSLSVGHLVFGTRVELVLFNGMSCLMGLLNVVSSVF